MNQGFVRIGNTGRQRVEWILTGADPCADDSQITHHIASDIVMPAIIAALHDNNMIAPSRRAGDPNGMIGGLGTRIGELKLLNGWNTVTEKLGQFPFYLVCACAHKNALVG